MDEKSWGSLEKGDVPEALYEGMLKDPEFRVYLQCLTTVYAVRCLRVKGVSRDVLVFSAGSLVRLARGAGGYSAQVQGGLGQASARYRSGVARVEGVARGERYQEEARCVEPGEPGPERGRCPSCRRFAPATFTRRFPPQTSDSPPEVVTCCPLCVKEVTLARREKR